MSGGPVPTGRKQPGQLFFTVYKGVQWFYYRESYKYNFPSIQHFPGGGGGSNIHRGVLLFPGGEGVQMLISIETHITCDFSGGSGPPISPLDQHMRDGIFEQAGRNLASAQIVKDLVSLLFNLPKF